MSIFYYFNLNQVHKSTHYLSWVIEELNFNQVGVHDLILINIISYVPQHLVSYNKENDFCSAQ